VTAAEALYKDKDEPIRLEAKHVAARALFAGAVLAEAAKKDSGKAGFAKASQLWKELERSTNNANLVRLSISQALSLDYRKEYASASSLLEKALERNLGSTATVEAAIELAGVLVKQGKFDEADKALSFVGPFLDRQVRVEMTEAEAAPFRQAAKVMQTRMVYFRSAGMKEFEQAESLRQQKKYPEAVAAFRAIIKSYPTSDFAPRSEYTIGLCLLAGQGQKQALEHWQKFIASSPAGPWRGQSLLAIIDCYINDLDLANAAKFSTLAQSNLDNALNDEKASPSWQPVQFDILLRAGIVSYCLDNTQAAAEAFAEAQTHAPSKEIANNIEPLVTAARAGKSVIPDDVKAGATGTSERRSTGPPASPRERVALALSIGVIHLASGQLDNAQTMFDRVTGTSAVPAKSGAPAQPARPAMQGATPAQLAFAIFGKAAVLQASAKSSPVKIEQAREQFLVSIKAFGDGSWHDESFYRVAVLAQEELNEKFGISSDSSTSSTKSVSLAKDASDKGIKASRDRAAAIFKAQQEILGYWQELLKHYPKSPRAEYASWAFSQLQYEMAQTTPAENSTQFFKDASLSANRFCETWPRSPLVGSAYRIQMTVATEYLFDLKQSKAIAPKAAQWAKAAIEGKTADPPALSPWAMLDRRQDESQIKHIAQDCLLQAGLIAYLSGQFDQAAEWIDAAGPLAPGEGFTEKPDLESIGLYYVLKTIRSKKSVTDKQALDATKTDEQRFLLQLGDLYIESIRPDRAEEVFLHILDRDPRLGQIPPALEGYAMLQIATALDRQEGRRPEALVMLKKLVTRRELQGTHWGGYGLFRLALFTYNQTQDAKQSLPLYQQMLKQYPNHEVAELAHYYLCLDAIRLKDNALAEKEGQSFLKKYPKSEYREVLRDRLSKLAKEKGQESK